MEQYIYYMIFIPIQLGAMNCSTVQVQKYKKLVLVEYFKVEEELLYKYLYLVTSTT